MKIFENLCVVIAFCGAGALGAGPPNLKELVLLHTNDMHSRILGVDVQDNMCTLQSRDKESCFGGFDRIFTVVNQERKKNESTIVVDAGDQFQGTLFHQLYRGRVSAMFMNQIRYDAMAVGNHEFDNGPQVLAEFIKEMKFPLLSANINVSADKDLAGKVRPYTIVQKGKLRVGIIGYTTEDTAYLSSPGPDVRIGPIIDNVKKAVLELKKARVDVIIALSHSGLKRDQEIASQVDGIAAIVCGHSNSLLSNKVKNSDGPSPLVIMSPSKKPVLLVSAYAYGKYLGYLKFRFDSRGVPVSWEADPILLDTTIERNPAIAKEAENLYKPISHYEKQLVGSVPVDINSQECRFEECIFGNLITDAMSRLGKPLGASIAIMNAGGIRASLPKGPVNQAQVKDVLPFEKKVVFVKLKGDSIRKILEHGVSFAENKANDNTGRFLQVSGLKYSFNPSHPRGKRVKDIQVQNPDTELFEPIKPEQIYGVAANSYLVQGGDKYSFFAESVERWSMELSLKDVLSAFFKSPISQLPKREGRIVKLDE